MSPTQHILSPTPRYTLRYSYQTPLSEAASTPQERGGSIEILSANCTPAVRTSLHSPAQYDNISSQDEDLSESEEQTHKRHDSSTLEASDKRTNDLEYSGCRPGPDHKARQRDDRIAVIETQEGRSDDAPEEDAEDDDDLEREHPSRAASEVDEDPDEEVDEDDVRRTGDDDMDDMDIRPDDILRPKGKLIVKRKFTPEPPAESTSMSPLNDYDLGIAGRGVSESPILSPHVNSCPDYDDQHQRASVDITGADLSALDGDREEQPGKPSEEDDDDLNDLLGCVQQSIKEQDFKEEPYSPLMQLPLPDLHKTAGGSSKEKTGVRDQGQNRLLEAVGSTGRTTNDRTRCVTGCAQQPASGQSLDQDRPPAAAKTKKKKSRPTERDFRVAEELSQLAETFLCIAAEPWTKRPSQVASADSSSIGKDMDVNPMFRRENFLRRVSALPVIRMCTCGASSSRSNRKKRANRTGFPSVRKGRRGCLLCCASKRTPTPPVTTIAAVMPATATNTTAAHTTGQQRQHLAPLSLPLVVVPAAETLPTKSSLQRETRGADTKTRSKMSELERQSERLGSAAARPARRSTREKTEESKSRSTNKDREKEQDPSIEIISVAKRPVSRLRSREVSSSTESPKVRKISKYRVTTFFS